MARLAPRKQEPDERAHRHRRARNSPWFVMGITVSRQRRIFGLSGGILGSTDRRFAHVVHAIVQTLTQEPDLRNRIQGISPLFVDPQKGMYDCR